MPHPRFKSENYENFGGINVKASAYNTGPRDVLDLKNFDFSVIGAWTKRPGSTQYLAQTFAPITGLHEYVRIDGFSQLMVGATGAMWAGATTGAMGGLSNADLGATLQRYAATDYAIYADSAGFFLYDLIGRTGDLILNSRQFTGREWDFVNYLNQAYMTDGNVFLRYNGASTFLTNLIPGMLGPLGASFGATIALPYIMGASGGASLGFPIGSLYHVYAALVSSNGTEGPLGHLGVFDLTSAVAATIVSYGGTLPVCEASVFTPSVYGLSAINLYVATQGASYPSAAYGLSAFGLDIRFLGSTSVSGTNVTLVRFGLNPDQRAAGGITGLPVAEQVISPYFLPSVSGYTLTSLQSGFSFQIIQGSTFSPRFLEIYNNRLALVGFSLLPSTFAITEIAEPESILPESVFEVRTNDGDVLTGAKFYLNQLILFKQKSVHSFTGDAPENFYLKQISNEFGCLNNKAICVWNDRLWFLDEKGIIEFNGANIGSVSTKVETIFASMNVSAAIGQAVMLHQKERNEVWCGIPVNGATLNNLTVIYDYDANAWTTWDGFNPKYFANVRQRLNKTSGFYADYVGRVNYFDETIAGDNGAGISCVIKARYEHPLGQSTEKMFRRAFLNYESTSGSTITGFDLKLRRNYGDSVVVSKGITLSSFQQVTNFGVSAKSLSIEVGHFSATERLRIYGYTLEYRYQRAT